MPDLVASILSPDSLVVAAVGGFGAGWLVIGNVIRSGLLGIATAGPRFMAGAVVLLALSYGGVFWFGQVSADIAHGDPAWVRPAARSLVYALFSVAAGVGVWACLSRDR